MGLVEYGVGGAIVLLVVWAFIAKFKSGDEEKVLDAKLQKEIDDPNTSEPVRKALIKLRDLKLQEMAQAGDDLRKKIKSDVSAYLAEAIPALEARIAKLEKAVKKAGKEDAEAEKSE